MKLARQYFPVKILWYNYEPQIKYKSNHKSSNLQLISNLVAQCGCLILKILCLSLQILLHIIISLVPIKALAQQSLQKYYQVPIIVPVPIMVPVPIILSFQFLLILLHIIISPVPIKFFPVLLYHNKHKQNWQKFDRVILYSSEVTLEVT